MFITLQSEDYKNNYFQLLKTIGGLSGLFSDNNIPFLYYRAAENVFCKAFKADNLSRSDCSIDARKGNMGIGLKTFINGNGRTYQKIAEFNKNRNDYMNKGSRDDIVYKISSMRNKRIESTKTIHGVEDIIYHCVAREKDRFLIYEEEMDYIDIESIKIISKQNNNLIFKDKTNEYNFNISKSTLSKRFYTSDNPTMVEVSILEDPFTFLQEYDFNSMLGKRSAKDEVKSVILPLYSTKYNKVMEKSGLNQWNASGRLRDKDEAYIPVPMAVHRMEPDFFPLKDKPFNLVLPNKKIISVKMCQNSPMELDGVVVDKGKGLMSNPNIDLGKWILRDILKIPVGQLVTMEDLYSIGIDSVEIRKISQDYFEIDFKEIGSYDEFILK